ncbi:hypothetical protein GCM10010156_78310 [Planobispora rosea]|nr:hypothetical protein GCM10010156_78310 [Planobispora rosea]
MREQRHLHCALTYGSRYGSHPRLWYYTEPIRDPSGSALALVLLSTGSTVLGLFFLIAGFFVPASHDRKGGRAFVRDRLLRLGLPIAVYVLLIRPFVTLGDYLVHYREDLSFGAYYVRSWSLGPMWFLETLLVFCLCYAALRSLRRGRAIAVMRPHAASGVAPHTTPHSARRSTPWVAGAVIGCCAGLAVLTYLWRIIVPIGSYWPVVDIPNPGCLPLYTALFIAGVLARRGQWHERMPRAAGLWGLAAAGSCLAAALPVLPSLINRPPQPESPLSLVMAFLETGLCVGSALAVVVLFRARFNRQRGFGAFLAVNAFAVYLLHPVVVVGFGHVLSQWRAPAAAKCLLLWTLALPLCWGGSHLVRRVPAIARLL